MNEARRVLLDEGQTSEAYSFCIDLGEIQLGEVENPKWIQATRIGVFQHPQYGKLDFRLNVLQEYVSNFRAGVRGQDLNIDFGHEEFRDDAAGWVKDVEVRTSEPEAAHNGLWYLVEWTEEGLRQLANKAYRYFSADYNLIWKDPSGKVHKHVLNGGALTNRPYVKGMKPIALSELDTSERQIMNRDALEALAKSLGVEFDESTTDEALNTLVSEAALAQGDSDSDSNNTDEDDILSGDTIEEIDAGELVGQLSENDKKNPLIQRLLADRAATDKRLKALEAANRLSEVNVKLSSLRSDGDIKLALTPKAEGKFKSIMLSVDSSTASSIFDLVRGILTDGTRQLGELGTSNKDGGRTDSDVGIDFDAEVQKLREADNNLSYVDAVTRVTDSNPDLYRAYLDSIRNGGGN